MPLVDDGYVALAYVNVAAGVTSIVQGDIVDARTLLLPSGGARLMVMAIVQTSGSTTTILGQETVGLPGIGAEVRVVGENQLECCIRVGQTDQADVEIRGGLGWPSTPVGCEHVEVGAAMHTVVDATIQSNYSAMNLAIGQHVVLAPIHVGMATLVWTGRGTQQTTVFTGTYVLTLMAVLRNVLS